MKSIFTKGLALIYFTALFAACNLQKTEYSEVVIKGSN